MVGKRRGGCEILALERRRGPLALPVDIFSVACGVLGAAWRVILGITCREILREAVVLADVPGFLRWSLFGAFRAPDPEFPSGLWRPLPWL